MKKRVHLLKHFTIDCFLLLMMPLFLMGQAPGSSELQRISLPNGWQLSPVGRLVPLGDFPLNIAVSPSGKIAAVTNNGQSTQSIQLVDVKRSMVTDSVVIGKAWLGLVFSEDGKSLYASGGNDNIVIRYAVRDKRFIPADTLKIGKPWPEKISVAGIAVDEKAGRLYAVTKVDNSLYVFDLREKRSISQHPLGGEGYTCLLSPDRKTLYATCWGCDKVVIFDTGKQEISGSVPVGDNPNDMCITKNGRYLFVANANDNNVSVIDTRQSRVIETLNAALYPDALTGSTTNGVGLSKDNRTLYIANADNNCLAVFDVSVPGKSTPEGFIPTGWYPTSVRVAKNKILVTNGKGISSQANPFGPQPTRKGSVVETMKEGKLQKIGVQYIAGLFRGILSIIDTPGKTTMEMYSGAVFDNTPYIKEKELVAEGMEGNPVPRKVGDPSPIKYVFYVIKENRTYDQVLGDMPEGNGDPELVLFGEKITPNQHALAREFVLLDNFFVDGEVSADGHNWSMGAYATDFLEKTWPTRYGGRGGSASHQGTKNISNNKNGFLWDYCQRAGVSYRTYGEFISVSGIPNIPVLEGHYCRSFTPWVQSVRDTTRFYQWKRDFDALLAAGALPQLNTIRFINDHTEGLKLGCPTPFAHVADNDLAVGMFVDYLSHSPIWKESVILIVEDDAQNGPDHVDAHRSTAYLAGGFVKQGFVDHTAYTTASLLRTIELILGLPPMSQYDAAATPLWRCFDNTPDHPPFTTRHCFVDLNEKNSALSIWQKKSEEFDFSQEDRIDDTAFNEVIWRAVKGLDSPCPAVVRAAFLVPEKGGE